MSRTFDSPDYGVAGMLRLNPTLPPRHIVRAMQENVLVPLSDWKPPRFGSSTKISANEVDAFYARIKDFVKF
jgi:hypothetical protein